MRRGDVVLANFTGDYGKTRPAVIMQRDKLDIYGFTSVIVCPITSSISGVRHVRILVEPDRTNGLMMQSEVMVEKIAAIAQHRLKSVIGHLDDQTMKSIEVALLVVLGFV